MKRFDLELRPFIGPGIAALIAAAILGATLQVGGAWLDERADAFRRARADLARAAERHRNASDDQAVYEQYATRFLDMRDRGWIGPEERLGWIEALQRVNADLRLPTLGYDIGEQSVTDSGGPGLELRRTPMTLRLGALHEGDLLELLDRLQMRGKGLMSVERCELSRRGERVELDAESANVEIACQLDWYMLRMTRRKEAVETGERP